MSLLVLGSSLIWGQPQSFAAGGESLEWIAVDPTTNGFRLAGSGKPFVPWGFNYDHDETGRLIEDYWHTHWAKVEEDFQEMKDLGANVVRIHLQFGRFMKGLEEPNSAELDRLQALLGVCERLKLYLNITGLGCYHKADVPPWYDRLSEAERWEAQARFWEEIAKVCAASPAVFCYDLMNEPVVPGGDQPRTDWLGPPFGNKHFVQFITLDRAGRERPEIARSWITRLVAAIRRQDPRHLITVGLVPWSLDRPGLTSGFVPEKIVDLLDFISVHLYPESGKLDESLAVLRGFCVGKPVVIEEIFPLRCTVGELEQFIAQSRGSAAGWVGFYWGRTPEECRRSNQLVDHIVLAWLELFRKGPPLAAP